MAGAPQRIVAWGCASFLGLRIVPWALRSTVRDVAVVHESRPTGAEIEADL
jgi:hypothetical protein